MKYFTKHMLKGSLDFKNTKYWDKVFKTNRHAYEKQLNKLKKRMTKRNFQFFSDPYYRNHDFVLKIDVINRGRIRFYKKGVGDKLNFANDANNTIRIEMLTLCPDGYFTKLQYGDIKKYVIDYPTDDPLWFEGKNGHGSWYEDELVYLGKGIYRHEILLHSGATILIDFRTFDYKRIKIQCTRDSQWQKIYSDEAM